MSKQYTDADLALPVESTLAVIEVLNQQIHLIEKRVKARASYYVMRDRIPFQVEKCFLVDKAF